MYKLVIVDDEKAIRKGIRDYIDWKSMGFEVVESFEDGKETIHYLEQNSIDVILTDIEMAEVSGIELAKYVHENKSEVKVVIISGYKEFEYARKAVEYGVEHYLLKPIRMDEVSKVFLKIKNLLEQEHSKNSNKKDNNFEELLPELREQFWISLVVGGLCEEEKIRKRMKMVKIDLDETHPFAIVDVKLTMDNTTGSEYYTGENYRNLVHNICHIEDEDIVSIPMILNDDVIKVIVTTKREEDSDTFKNKLEELLLEQCRGAESLLKIKVNTKIEKVMSHLMDIRNYNCMVSVSSEEFSEYGGDLLPEDQERLLQKYKLLMETINDGDLDGLDSLVDTIFLEFRNLPLKRVQHLCVDMFAMLSAKFIHMGIDVWKNMNEMINYEKLLVLEKRSLLKAECKNLLCEVVKILQSKQNMTSKRIVEESIKYLKIHYADEISLDHVAGRFFLNQAYFSRLFKQYTGNTFTDYLIELRMEKAKEILEQGKYKVYEVSQMVGYHSEKYFFRIFKQYTGCSPTEYARRRVINEKG